MLEPVRRRALLYGGTVVDTYGGSRRHGTRAITIPHARVPWRTNTGYQAGAGHRRPEQPARRQRARRNTAPRGRGRARCRRCSSEGGMDNCEARGLLLNRQLGILPPQQNLLQGLQPFLGAGRGPVIVHRNDALTVVGTGRARSAPDAPVHVAGGGHGHSRRVWCRSRNELRAFAGKKENKPVVWGCVVCLRANQSDHRSLRRGVFYRSLRAAR